MKTLHTDVLIIGTGFGAAAPALRLAQAGAKVTMIEKGPRVQTADFRQTSDPRYLLKYLRGTPGDHLSLTYAEALGGGSGFYEMVSLRAPSVAFDQLDAQGHPQREHVVEARPGAQRRCVGVAVDCVVRGLGPQLQLSGGNSE